MVFIRNKRIKGTDYAYLVQNKWDPDRNMPRQIVIKYLGKSSSVSMEDIPEEYRKVPKIAEFISSHHGQFEKKEHLVPIPMLQDELFNLVSKYDIAGLTNFYNRHSKTYGVDGFYDQLVKPVLYLVGDLWQRNLLDVGTEHVCSNAVTSIIKTINRELVDKIKSKPQKSKILICTPEGELHHHTCNMMESLLLLRGYSVYNISPSVPANSIVGYANKIEPDILIVSVTLEENILSAVRLVREFRLHCGKDIPIMIGGAPFSKIKNKQTVSTFFCDTKIMIDCNQSPFKNVVKMVREILKS
jgi:methanogenic corrinoid protein MtbC1